jgi:hypothetical protein
MNLNDAKQPFDLLFVKGVKTGIQFALFGGMGAASDDRNALNQLRMAESYGAGFRLVFSGAVLRLDVARGEEGSEYNLFFGYPWDMTAL